MKIFNTKPKVPLKVAIDLIDQAIETAYTYKRDKRYMPSKADLELFKRLSETFQNNNAVAGYINQCMNQRFKGEPEGASKWHNKEAAEYHNIP